MSNSEYTEKEYHETHGETKPVWRLEVITFIIFIVINVGGLAYGYGVVNERLNQHEEKIKSNDNRIEIISKEKSEDKTNIQAQLSEIKITLQEIKTELKFKKL